MKTKPSKYKPFFLVTDEKLNNRVVIVAGNTRVSPLEFESEEEAEEYLSEQPYEMFINLYAVFKYYEKEEQESHNKDVAKD